MAIQSGDLTVPKVNKKNIFSGRILESGKGKQTVQLISGLRNLGFDNLGSNTTSSMQRVVMM